MVHLRGIRISWAMMKNQYFLRRSSKETFSKASRKVKHENENENEQTYLRRPGGQFMKFHRERINKIYNRNQ